MAGMGYSLHETTLGGSDHNGGAYRGRLLHYQRQLAQTWHP